MSPITGWEVAMDVDESGRPARPPSRPRVWLVDRIGTTPEPADLPAVRDTWLRTWVPGTDGVYHSADGWHHATWAELHARFDLIEVA